MSDQRRTLDAILADPVAEAANWQVRQLIIEAGTSGYLDGLEKGREIWHGVPKTKEHTDGRDDSPAR